MTTSHESEKAPMETAVKPSSLAQVAHSQAAKVQGNGADGTGLETRGIHAWFGKHHALADINLKFCRWHSDRTYWSIRLWQVNFHSHNQSHA